MNKKEVLVISIGIFLTVAAWMIIDIYRAHQQPILNVEIRQVRFPPVKLDLSVLEKLKLKQ
jgi:hypothetical protein